MPTQRLHHPRNTILRLRRYKQMHMVSHKHPGMNRDLEFGRALGQPIGVSREILLRRKTGLTIIAALNNVLWNAGQTHPR